MKTALLFASFSVLAACAVPTGSSDPGTGALGSGLGTGATCTAAVDCASGLECEHGRCQADAEASDGGAGQDDLDGGEHHDEHADGGHEQGEHHGGDGGAEADDDQGDGGQHGGSGFSCTDDSQCLLGEKCDDGACRLDD